MANPSAGFGFRPVRRIDGAAPSFQLIPAQIAYNNSNTIAKGDPCIVNSSGQIDIWASGALFGIFWGCEYLDPSLGYVDWKNSWAAPSGLASTTVVTGYVIADPMMVFEVVSPLSSNTLQASVYKNAAATTVGTPSPSGARGLSTATISGIATTSTLPFRIVGLSQKIGNNNAANNNIVEVMFNNSQYITGITGV